ncbi:hypothetical protein FDP41_005577 [Naegleria fowleri]|uniref:RNA helicase n=1 Tax=Naegleria fowleri TaxID=5763 RepID=A0A6A5BCE4_NAEFO|nr:uncharacterized protein FDP41_005577 [Naegleria fowleri]KAF0975583.1 hypothetical protein FDP41_005577 [Naegleria fowleri]
MAIFHLKEIIEIILTFLPEWDRKSSEQVSLTFHQACNEVEEREMIERLQFDEKALHKSILKALDKCRDDDRDEKLILKQLENIEKALNFKIPFHVRVYMKHSKIYPRNEAIPYIPNLNSFVLHPFMCISPIPQWKVRRGRDCVVIGEYQPRKNDKYLVVLNNREGKGELEVERHVKVIYHHLESQNFVVESIFKANRMETLVVGTLKKWVSNFGYLKDQSKLSVLTELLRSYPNNCIYQENVLSDNPKLFLEYFVANYKQGYVVMSWFNQLKQREYRELMKHKIITLDELPNHIRNDEKLIRFAVETNGINLRYLKRTHHNDRDLVIAAVRENGLAIAFASKALRNSDPFVFSQAFQNNQLAQYFSDTKNQKEGSIFSEISSSLDRTDRNDDFIDQFEENLQRGIYGWGIEYLTQFQKQIIQAICESGNKNVLIEGPCASGKTIASIIGVLHKGLDDSKAAPPDQVQCLVICPTRDMAIQVQLFFTSLCEYMKDITIGTSTGGLITYYTMEFAKSYRIIIGTPGRIAHKAKTYMELSHVKIVILEGSDQLCAGEFDNDLNVIFKRLPATCQSVLISSVFPQKVVMRIGQMLGSFKVLRLPMLTENLPHKHQFLDLLYEEEKLTLIKEIIIDHTDVSIMIFCNSRRNTERLSQELRDFGFYSLVTHGDMDDADRQKTVRDFRKGVCRILICTDTMARGLSISHLGLVVNYDFPENKVVFTERMGRLLHINPNKEKQVISFVTKEFSKKAKAWCRELGMENHSEWTWC